MSSGNRSMTPMALRELLRDALPSETSVEYSEPPPSHEFFVPKSHARALHLNIPLVLGDRGMGKSFWWSALQSEELRRYVEAVAPDTRIKRNTRVRPGFGKPFDLDHYPSRRVLKSLLGSRKRPYTIWSAVMLWAVVPPGELPDLSDWAEKVSWVEDHPEQADRLVQARDRALVAAEQDELVVFDSLDWATGDWEVLFDLLGGLLEVALEYRGTRRIRAKVFLRSDQFDKSRVARFPDASKLASSSVRLSWLKNELFGLLWQLLAFHPAKGHDFRAMLYSVVEKVAGKAEATRSRNDRLLPSSVYYNAEVQRALFHGLTGPLMGENARRGFPYTWLPSHLADAQGEVSPRSFLVALRTAAEHTAQHHAGWGFALHPRSLHAGLQAASAVRVDEIGETRWVPEVMGNLDDELLIPFTLDELAAVWKRRGTLEKLREVQAAAGDVAGEERPWFTPVHLDEDAAGVWRDLEVLGVARMMRTGKIDVPDIYRLGFGLRRKGGVAPKGGQA